MYILVQSQYATKYCQDRMCEVSRGRSRLAATSRVCDSTKHNGLVTYVKYSLICDILALTHFFALKAYIKNCHIQSGSEYQKHLNNILFGILYSDCKSICIPDCNSDVPDILDDICP